jgi:hypothetical protein
VWFLISGDRVGSFQADTDKMMNKKSKECFYFCLRHLEVDVLDVALGLGFVLAMVFFLWLRSASVM